MVGGHEFWPMPDVYWTTTTSPQLSLLCPSPMWTTQGCLVVVDGRWGLFKLVTLLNKCEISSVPSSEWDLGVCSYLRHDQALLKANMLDHPWVSQV